MLQYMLQYTLPCMLQSLLLFVFMNGGRSVLKLESPCHFQCCGMVLLYNMVYSDLDMYAMATVIGTVQALQQSLKRPMPSNGYQTTRRRMLRNVIDPKRNRIRCDVDDRYETTSNFVNRSSNAKSSS